LKDLILLDSDSTDTIFCNPKYAKISGNPNRHWSWGQMEDH